MNGADTELWGVLCVCAVDIDGAFGIGDRKRMFKSSCLVAQLCWEEFCVFSGKKKGLGSTGGWDFGDVL